MFDREPDTPLEPSLTNSLAHATSTIDELTVALTNYSRIPSPEVQYLVTCCCGRDECENTKSWSAFKSALENRLILSAEVGQALLQKHDSYVRQHEDCHKLGNSASNISDSVTSETVELRREKVALEKRLNQALVNAEVAEVSTRTAQQELEEARGTITRLTAQHARSLGWDSRLSAAMKERDDLQQERDSEAQRARQAETRIAALRQRMVKLQREVRRLQQDLEQRRSYRLESSKSLLQEARARIESLQESLGQTAMAEQAELMRVLGSLIDDNESLKRDNAELQNLLASSREDIQQMQEELEEQRAHQMSRGGESEFSRFSSQPGSVPSSFTFERSNPQKRPTSLEQRSRRPYQLPTPDVLPRPLSPADSFTTSETRSNPPQSRYPHSQLSLDLDEDSSLIKEVYHTRAVQTDPWHGLLSPSPYLSQVSSPSPGDIHSESSSVSESQAGHLTILVDRVAALLNRMVQADALTLTNRLKRQHLRGADVGHLSRSTIGNILNDITNLRFQFRPLLEDEKATTVCTRKDLRGLFKLFKDVFTELGTMRITLNDVILDPSIAVKVSELALNPSKGEVESDRGRTVEGQNPTLGGWIAPLSKLFGAPSVLSGTETTLPNRVSSPLARGSNVSAMHRPTAKIIPKLRPALSASNTTVNVEFSGSGLGRSVTSTFSAHATIKRDSSPATGQNSLGSTSAMDIFAGAPKVNPDPWVLIPNKPARASTLNPEATIGRRFGRSGLSRFSRDVDAVVDMPSTQPLDKNDSEGSEEQDAVPPLLERTLRRRGLSDSSIHSTFSSHQEDASSSSSATSPTTSSSHQGSSVFGAFSRTMQSFRIPSMGVVLPTGASSDATPSTHSSSTHRIEAMRIPRRTVSAKLPLPPWEAQSPFEVGSLAEEDLLHRRHILG